MGECPSTFSATSWLSIPISLCMFMKAKDLKQSIFNDSLSHVRNLLIHEKLLSHSGDLTSKVHLIYNNLNKFGNLISLHNFTDVDKAAGR